MALVRKRRGVGVIRGGKEMGLGLTMIRTSERVLLRLLDISAATATATSTADEATTLE